MNNINEQLRAITLNYVGKIHDIIDVALVRYKDIFGQELDFDPQNNAFVGTYNEYRIALVRDLNGLFVRASVIAGDDKNNEVVAEAGLNVEGKYTESYSRMSKDAKELVSKWFEGISEIDVFTYTTVNDAVEEPEEIIVEGEESKPHTGTAVMA